MVRLDLPNLDSNAAMDVRVTEWPTSDHAIRQVAQGGTSKKHTSYSKSAHSKHQIKYFMLSAILFYRAQRVRDI
jgi:hypothetical protein